MEVDFINMGNTSKLYNKCSTMRETHDTFVYCNTNFEGDKNNL